MEACIRGSLRSFTVAALAGLLGLVAALPLHAQDAFPSKPITVVIHARYGGGTDITARMMMIRTRAELGVDMQVVAKEGGSGVKAHQFAMEQPRDGYTVLALTQSHLYAIALRKSPLKIDDVVGVARAMDDPIFVVSASKGRFKTLKDLIEASRQGPLNWGVATIGGTEHIALARLAKAAGFKFKAVAFGSGAQMVQALMSGAIDATLPNVSESLQQVQDGTFLAVAVLADKRLKQYPGVPTATELGYPVIATTTRGYWVLKGTPQPVVDKLSKAMVKAMHHEVFVNYLKGSGLEVEDSVAGQEVWNKQIKEDYKQSEEALKELGLIK